MKFIKNYSDLRISHHRLRIPYNDEYWNNQCADKLYFIFKHFSYYDCSNIKYLYLNYSYNHLNFNLK